MDKQVKQYKRQLQDIYKPQAQILREQYQAQLPQFKAEEESLKQAKVNAFRDIGRQANRSGMFFSGFRPEEEAQYVGEEYLPALAGVSQQRNQLKLNLRSALAGLDTEKRQSVMDFRETLRQEAAERRRLQEQREYERQQLQEQRQYERQQAARQPTRSSSSGSRSSGGRQTPNFKVETNETTGGLSFYNDRGLPITAAQYAQGVGTTIADVLARSGDPGDQQILQEIQSGMTYDQLNQKYPWVFGL